MYWRATVVHEITHDTFFKIQLFLTDMCRKYGCDTPNIQNMSAVRVWASTEYKTRHNNMVTLTHQEILCKNILTTSGS